MPKSMPIFSGMGFPIWFHHHGLKMKVDRFDSCRKFVEIKGSAAKVIIEKSDSDGWKVSWEVQFSKDSNVEGVILMTTDELRSAFALDNKSGPFGEWLLERFGGDSAEQGRYIRYQGYLNIPGPGTGHDGDPNVSIFLDGEVEDAVYQLIEPGG